jgi:hypothetical protein
MKGQDITEANMWKQQAESLLLLSLVTEKQAFVVSAKDRCQIKLQQ